jgi:uncharacterized membrane protein
MNLLILGLVLFIGVHLLPSFVSLRRAAVDRLGPGAYKGLFSLLSLTGLVLMVIGKYLADFQPLWQPPAWGRNAALVLLLPVFVLLAAANMPSNIKRYTRHPMLWGVTLWSVGHLLSNGDRASLLLFGSLGVYALFGMLSANLRGAVKQVKVYPLVKDGVTVAAGLVVYAVLLLLHPYLFGVAVFQV